MTEYPKISLAAARVNAGFSQKEGAKRLGITPETLRSYEQGGTSPTMEMVEKIESIYKFPAALINFGKVSV